MARDSDDDGGEFVLVPHVRDLANNVQDEDVKVRFGRCTQFMGRRGIRGRLYNIAKAGLPCAMLALQILNADTSTESNEWTRVHHSFTLTSSRNVFIRHSKIRARPEKKVVKCSTCLPKTNVLNSSMSFVAKQNPEAAAPATRSCSDADNYP